MCKFSLIIKYVVLKGKLFYKLIVLLLCKAIIIKSI